MRAARAALIVLGTLLMAYAVGGALTDDDVRVFGVLLLLGAVLVLHDGVLLPLAIGVGVLIGRFVPVAARPAVRGAAFAALCVTLVALPLVGGWGRVADPSVAPLPYGRGLALTLAAIAVGALAAGVTAARRRRRPAGTAAPTGTPTGAPPPEALPPEAPQPEAPQPPATRPEGRP